MYWFFNRELWKSPTFSTSYISRSKYLVTIISWVKIFPTRRETQFCKEKSTNKDITNILCHVYPSSFKFYHLSLFISSHDACNIAGQCEQYAGRKSCHFSVLRESLCIKVWALVRYLGCRVCEPHQVFKITLKKNWE